MIGIELQETHWTTARVRWPARSPARGSRSSAPASSTSTSAPTCPGRTGARSWSWATPPGSPPRRWAGWRAGTSPASGTSRSLKVSRPARASNFDIAEAVWLKLLDELAGERPTIALLCKTSVARAVLEHARRRAVPVSDAAIFEIDAARWFGAAVGACLLRVTLGRGGNRQSHPRLAGLDEPAPAPGDGLSSGAAGRRFRRGRPARAWHWALARSPGARDSSTMPRPSWSWS